MAAVPARSLISSRRALSSASSASSAHGIGHRCRGLAEQDGALFGGPYAGRIGVDLLGFLVGPHDGRPAAHGFEPALEMRKVVYLLALALVRHDPGIARHVGD